MYASVCVTLVFYYLHIYNKALFREDEKKKIRIYINFNKRNCESPNEYTIHRA